METEFPCDIVYNTDCLAERSSLDIGSQQLA